MIDPKELAEALKDCFISVHDTNTLMTTCFIIDTVTPPPKKPEVEEDWLPVWKHGFMQTYWRPNKESGPSADPIAYWLRRETINGIAQTPTVVSGGK